MKHSILSYLTLTFVFLSSGLRLQAQTGQEGMVRVEQKFVDCVGEDLMINLMIDLSQVELASNQSMICTPWIESGDSVYALPPLVINGRNRQIQYERSEHGKQKNMDRVVRRYNRKEQKVDYVVTVPFRSWMERSEMYWVTDLCGCGWEALQNQKEFLFPIDLIQPEWKPILAYVNPPAEEVKMRVEEGSAFLDFPVNQILIYPDFRENRVELQKIQGTIDSIRADSNVTITGVHIKGYASPEGTYQRNRYLAENRAKALSDYVKKLYDFDQAYFTVDFEPEDWEGLEARIEASSLPDKEELLAIIRAKEPTDPDKREQLLRKVDGGLPYQTILRTIYPALRRSDYVIKYTIRNFTVEEARQLLYTNPKQLSLNEMYLVAQTYEPGSDAFREVFEIAVRMYPDDPISNLNAAMNAVAVGRIDAARRYLEKAPDIPERKLVEADILMLEGKEEEAKEILEQWESETVNPNL